MPLVLDCSALARWWVPAPEAPWSPRPPGRFLAPELLRIEWANTLGKLVRFRGLSRGDALAFRRKLEGLGVHWVPDGVLLDGAWDLTDGFRLSLYDALYVQLARVARTPIATADGKMSAAARERGVEVVWAGPPEK